MNSKKKLKAYKENINKYLIPYYEKELAKLKEEISRRYNIRHNGAEEEKQFLEEHFFDTYMVVGEKEFNIYDYEDFVKDKLYILRLEALPANKKFFNQTLYTDVKPYYCVEEISADEVIVAPVDVKRAKDAEPYSQDWEYQILEGSEKKSFTLKRHKNGLFYEVGSKYCPFRLSDKPNYYYDYSF